MFAAILWDMDGTLVDTEHLVWEVIRSAFQEAAGIALPDDLFSRLIGQSEADFYRGMAQLYSLGDADVSRIRDAFNRDYLPRLARVAPLPGAVQRVREFAAKAPQALVTGSTSAQAGTVLAALKLADAFRHVVACDTYSRGKPDPEPFLAAAQRLGVDPSRCVAIEDSPSGVTAARRAGVKVVGIHEGNRGKYDISHADLELTSLLDLSWERLLTLL